jgi:hypothetical protein
LAAPVNRTAMSIVPMRSTISATSALSALSPET